MSSLIRTPKEEGHYTIKRVDRLPPKGNMNWLYTFRTTTLEKFYRWTTDGVYEEITVGGAGSSITNTSQLVNDGASGTSTYVELTALSTVAISGDYNDLLNAPANVIESIVAGTNVTVDNTDPANPIVSATGGGGGGITSVVGSANISVDNTDPNNPVVSALNLVTIDTTQTVTGQKTWTNLNTFNSSVDIRNGNIFVEEVYLTPHTPFGGSLTGRVDFGVDTTYRPYFHPEGGTSNAFFNFNGITADREYLFQDGSGTLAFLTDIPTSLVSVVGGTNIDIDNTDPSNPIVNAVDVVNTTSAQSVAGNKTFTGTLTAASFLQVNATNPAQNIFLLYPISSLGATTAVGGAASYLITAPDGSLVWRGTANPDMVFSNQSLTERRTYTLQDGDGTLAFLSDIPAGGSFNSVVAGDGITVDATDPDNPIVSSTALEALNEGGGIGWRLIGKDPDNYGNIGLHAVDFSRNDLTSTTRGATGQDSFATGTFNTASGGTSFAIGTSNIVSGAFSFVGGGFSQATGFECFAFGNGAVSSGTGSVAMGRSAQAAGNSAFALGQNVTSVSYAEAVVGLFATNYTANSAFAHDPADRAFNVGIGTDGANRADGLTVFKNGEVLAPELDNATIDAAGGTVLITKDWANANLGGGGGQVDSVVAGTNVTVDNTDPVNPIVNAVIPTNFSGSSVTPVTTVGAGLTIGMDIAVPAGTLENDGDALEFFAIFDTGGEDHVNLGVSCNLGISAATCNNFNASTAFTQIVARGHVIRLNATTVRQYIVCNVESDPAFSEVNSNQSTVTDLDTTSNQFRIFFSDSAISNSFQFITGRVTKQ